jgi:hypothetical protein
VAAKIEAVAVTLDRLRETTDLIFRLEHDNFAPGLAEQIAGRQARGAAA